MRVNVVFDENSDGFSKIFDSAAMSLDKALRQVDNPLGHVEQGLHNFNRGLSTFEENLQHTFGSLTNNIETTAKSFQRNPNRNNFFRPSATNPTINRVNQRRPTTQRQHTASNTAARHQAQPTNQTTNHTSNSPATTQSSKTETSNLNSLLQSYLTTMQKRALSNSERFYKISNTLNAAPNTPKAYTDKYDGKIFIEPMNLPCLLHGKTYDYNTLANRQTTPDTFEPFNLRDIQPAIQTQADIDVFLSELEKEC